MPSKTPPARAPGVPALASSSVLIREVRGQNASSPATSYSPLVTPPKAVRMPYFMHPSVYHKGLHKKVSSTRNSPPVTSYPPQRRRRFRIGFFGTHDPEFYSKHYHFPGMNRTEILNVFLSKFADQIQILEGSPDSWPDAQIVVAMDERGGDRIGKSFLSQADYFEAMRECDFVLSPPGICTPLSHNLIEAMFCGAIPITNAGVFMARPLEGGSNCLEFFKPADFFEAIEKALSMTYNEIWELRLGAFDYYWHFLKPLSFGNLLKTYDGKHLFVNGEEKSVPFVHPQFIWPPTKA